MAPSGFSVPVDEAEQVAVVEEREAVHLVHDARVPAQPIDDDVRELEAHVDAARPQVQEEVAGGRDGRVGRPDDRLERVQALRPGEVVHPIP